MQYPPPPPAPLSRCQKISGAAEGMVGELLSGLIMLAALFMILWLSVATLILFGVVGVSPFDPRLERVRAMNATSYRCMLCPPHPDDLRPHEQAPVDPATSNDVLNRDHSPSPTNPATTHGATAESSTNPPKRRCDPVSSN